MITYSRIFEDSSGAPAVIHVDGMIFTFDFLRGEIAAPRLVQNRSESLRASKRAVGIARSEYVREIVSKLSPEWIEANRALYAD
jgi:hypothetical protein